MTKNTPQPHTLINNLLESIQHSNPNQLAAINVFTQKNNFFTFIKAQPDCNKAIHLCLFNAKEHATAFQWGNSSYYIEDHKIFLKLSHNNPRRNPVVGYHIIKVNTQSAPFTAICEMQDIVMPTGQFSTYHDLINSPNTYPINPAEIFKNLNTKTDIPCNTPSDITAFEIAKSTIHTPIDNHINITTSTTLYKILHHNTPIAFATKSSSPFLKVPLSLFSLNHEISLEALCVSILKTMASSTTLTKDQIRFYQDPVNLNNFPSDILAMLNFEADNITTTNHTETDSRPLTCHPA